MDPASTTLKLLAVLALIGINAFFVAAEFALMSSRRSRVEPLARSGHRRAQRVLAALDAPESVIAAAQLGVVAATVGIGWISQSVVYGMVQPRLDAWATGGLGAGASVGGGSVGSVPAGGEPAWPCGGPAIACISSMSCRRKWRS